jgi:hypothetical protein
MTDPGASAILEVTDSGTESINQRPVLLVDPDHFDFSTGAGEYFMLEYRNPDLSPTSYDTDCFARGLFLWHCATGPGGANHPITGVLGACCDGATCGLFWRAGCPGTSIFKGEGVACGPGGSCPAGSPAPTGLDGSINLQSPWVDPSGHLNYLRGYSATAWTDTYQPSGGVNPKYLDGTDSSVRILLRNVGTNSRTLEVEWSPTGNLPERIDTLEKYRFRRTRKQDMQGMFGVRPTHLYVYGPFNSYLGELAYDSQTVSTIGGVRAPDTFPLGTYTLVTSGSAYESNPVQITITPKADWDEDGVLGEISTEISAVADVRPVYTPDWNADGAITTQDIFDFLADWFGGD